MKSVFSAFILGKWKPSTTLSQQKSETFIITALELFIQPFECQIWILSHHNDGEYIPHFVAWCKDGSKAYQFAMNLRCLNQGSYS